MYQVAFFRRKKNAYAQKVKISNLQKMANTIIFVQEHGYNTQNELKCELISTKESLEREQINLSLLSEEMKSLNSKIHYTVQYLTNKKCFASFLKASNNKLYRSEHKKEIQAYEIAKQWLNQNSNGDQPLSLKELKSQRINLQEKIDNKKCKCQYKNVQKVENKNVHLSS